MCSVLTICITVCIYANTLRHLSIYTDQKGFMKTCCCERCQLGLSCWCDFTFQNESHFCMSYMKYKINYNVINSIWIFLKNYLAGTFLKHYKIVVVNFMFGFEKKKNWQFTMYFFSCQVFLRSFNKENRIEYLFSYLEIRKVVFLEFYFCIKMKMLINKENNVLKLFLLDVWNLLTAWKYGF